MNSAVTSSAVTDHVVQVEGVDQSSLHHECPEAIDDVAAEQLVVGLRQLFS